jgi:hypothetical protein
MNKMTKNVENSKQAETQALNIPVVSTSTGMNRLKFRVIFWKNNPERTSIVNENNFNDKYLIGLNGLLYENYGTKDKPMWECNFDSEYEIELICNNIKIFNLNNCKSFNECEKNINNIINKEK